MRASGANYEVRNPKTGMVFTATAVLSDVASNVLFVKVYWPVHAVPGPAEYAARLTAVGLTTDNDVNTFGWDSFYLGFPLVHTYVSRNYRHSGLGAALYVLGACAVGDFGWSGIASIRVSRDGDTRARSVQALALWDKFVTSGLATTRKSSTTRREVDIIRAEAAYHTGLVRRMR